MSFPTGVNETNAVVKYKCSVITGWCISYFAPFAADLLFDNNCFFHHRISFHSFVGKGFEKGSSGQAVMMSVLQKCSTRSDSKAN